MRFSNQNRLKFPINCLFKYFHAKLKLSYISEYEYKTRLPDSVNPSSSDVVNRLPEGTHRIPEGTHRIPEGTHRIPEGTHRLQDGLLTNSHFSSRLDFFI